MSGNTTCGPNYVCTSVQLQTFWKLHVQLLGLKKGIPTNDERKERAWMNSLRFVFSREALSPPHDGTTV